MPPPGFPPRSGAYLFAVLISLSLLIDDSHGTVAVDAPENPPGTTCSAGYFLYEGSCFLCPNGTTSTAGATFCTSCVFGTYSSASTSGLCASCSPGQVPNVQQNLCIACDAGYIEVSNACELCSSGQTSTTGSTICFDCATGTYSSASTNGLCVACPSGQVPNVQRSGCVSCSAGYYEVNDMCEACPAGQSSTVAATSCSSCVEGSFSSALTNHLCTPCTAGTYTAPNQTLCLTCSAGYSSPQGSSSCIACNSSTYSDPFLSDGICSNCPLGYIPSGAASGSGPTLCEICPANTYQIGTSCIPCPGSSSSPAGSFLESQCSVCQFGQFINASVSNVCTDCPSGTYSIGSGCEVCPPGSTSSVASASSPSQCVTCSADNFSSSSTFGLCNKCPGGQVPTIALDGCIPCPQGYYEFPDGFCTPCPIGQTTSAAGASLALDCILCPSGQSSTVETDFLCQNCAAGTFSNASRVCETCPGTLVSSAGASSCSECSPGYYSESNQCLLCPDGTTSTPGATRCVSCNTSMYSNGSTLGICTFCPAGQGANLQRSACITCPTGQYSSALSEFICTSCPAGTFSTGLTCELCPNGTQSASGSASSAAECPSCPPGSISSAATNGICIPCATGLVPDGASTVCIPAPPSDTSIEAPVEPPTNPPPASPPAQTPLAQTPPVSAPLREPITPPVSPPVCIRINTCNSRCGVISDSCGGTISCPPCVPPPPPITVAAPGQQVTIIYPIVPFFNCYEQKDNSVIVFFGYVNSAPQTQVRIVNNTIVPTRFNTNSFKITVFNSGIHSSVLKLQLNRLLDQEASWTLDDKARFLMSQVGDQSLLCVKNSTVSFSMTTADEISDEQKNQTKYNIAGAIGSNPSGVTVAYNLVAKKRDLSYIVEVFFVESNSSSMQQQQQQQSAMEAASTLIALGPTQLSAIIAQVVPSAVVTGPIVAEVPPGTQLPELPKPVLIVSTAPGVAEAVPQQGGGQISSTQRSFLFPSPSMLIMIGVLVSLMVI